MRKKTLISVACGLAAISCVAGLNTLKASASTTFTNALNDDFEASTSLNTENWNELASDSGATIGVKNDIYLTLALANAGSVSTKEALTIADTDCLVMDIDMRHTDIAGANLSFVWGSESKDLTGASSIKGFNLFTDGMMMYNASYTFPKYNADHTQNPMWTTWARDKKITIYVQPDGSAYFYQDDTLVCYAKATDMTDAMKTRNGYAGICHSGGAGTILMTDYIKIGTMPATEFELNNGKPVASRAVSDNTTWLIDDSNPTKAGLSDAFETNQTSDIVGWQLANNYLNVNENAAEVVSKAQIPAADARIDKVFEMTADWDVTGLGDATAEFAFGDVSVGIAKHDDKNYLTIWDSETVVAETEITLGNGEVQVVAYGNGLLKAIFNGVTINSEVSSFAGTFSYNVTAGASNITLDNLVLTTGVYENKGGASQATDFTEVDEDKWYIGSTEAMAGYPTGGGVYVENGQLVFMNAGDASMIATKESYTNYEFGFDLLYIEQEGQENDDGDITRAPSFFPGIVYGMPNYDTFFGTEDMVYFQKQTVDLFGAAKFADGSTRAWLTTDQDMYTQNAAGKVINFKFVAKDGTITVTITNKTDDVEMYTFQVFNQDTTGHVSLQTTGCGNFDIDNMYIINLDETTDYTLTQKTIEAKTENVFEGKTIEGAIDLGDMTNKTATFTVAEAVEGFTMNADGTYTYVAPAMAPTAPVVVNYSVAIDDFTLGFVNPVGDASKYTVNSTITINVTAIVVSSIEVTAPTKVAYKTGEEIDLNGLVVKAIYNDGTEVTLSDGYTVDSSAVNFAEAGEYNVTVSFEGASATFKVTVEKASGCFGTAMLASMVSALGLGFAALLVKKGKEED